MKTNPIRQLTAVSWFLFASSALGGQWLDLYWPLSQGDHKAFIYDRTNELTLDVSDHGGGEWEICVDSVDVSECLNLQCDETGCFLVSAETMGTSVSFDPPVLLLNDTMLQNGGSVKTVTSATQFGLAPYPATFTVTVAKSGTVSVPAGTFLDCRSIKATEVASIPGYGTITASALTAFLGPRAGIIKTLVLRPSDYASLVSGTVGGVDVGCLADATLLQLTITVPRTGQRFSNAVATVQGLATHAASIGEVRFRINDGDWQTAQTSNGWTNWSSTVNLLPGTNTVHAYALNECGIASPTQSVSFSYVVSDRLTVGTNGSGRISPNYDQQLLEIGKTYTITAAAADGYVFCGWTGGVSTNTGKLTFVMQSNLVLQANFIPNPFVAVKGTYRGLFYPVEGRTAGNSGYFTATTTDKGKYTAKLQTGGKTYSFTGQFSCEGNASRLVAPKGLTPLTVVLELDWASGDFLRGQVSGESWVADLTAHRSSFDARTNTAPQTAKYTMVIAGEEDSTTAPGGESIGTVSVDARGKVKFAGTLADGTRITQSAALSKEGLWPAYVSLYGGQGLLIGWLAFADHPADDFSGTLDWIKPAQATAKYYPAGFAIRPEAVGAKYVQPARGSRVINLTAGQVLLANGNLGQSITNQVALGTDNIVTDPSINKRILTITPSTGLFKGSVPEIGTTRSLAINGVILQKRNAGFGFFLGTNQTGRVYFGQ